MMKKYISKPDQWFDAGTEAKLIAPCTETWGIFEGIRNGKIDEEDCGFDEFDIIDVPDESNNS